MWLQKTRAGLAELDVLHTHFEAGRGCAIDKSLWEAIQIRMPSGKRLLTLVQVNCIKYFIECPLKATVGVS